jgi:hypothetical protein
VEELSVTPAKAGARNSDIKRIQSFLDSGLHRNDVFDPLPEFFNSLPTALRQHASGLWSPVAMFKR